MSASVVLFDAGGTLFADREPRDAAYARLLREAGTPVSDAAMPELRGQVFASMPDAVPGGTRYSDPWFIESTRRMLQRLGSRTPPEQAQALLTRHFADPASYAVFADAPPALASLKARGSRLAVVSNWGPHLHALLDGLGLRPAFDLVVASAEAGSSKPDPRIFTLTLERLGAAPAEAVHVGDQRALDVEGARAAGLEAFLLDRSGREPAGPRVLRSLSELPGRLGPPLGGRTSRANA